MWNPSEHKPNNFAIIFMVVEVEENDMTTTRYFLELHCIAPYPGDSAKFFADQDFIRAMIRNY